MTTSPDGTAPLGDAVRDQRPAATPTCFRHQDRETYLRCHRCERSICTDCMISAAVGFQCPECVRGGAKATRQPRTSVGGRVHVRQGVVTISLIAVNVVMYGLQQLAGAGFSARLDLTAVSGAITADPHIGVANGEWYRLVTAMFLHLSPAHIVMNMLSLWWIGLPVESRLGRLRFLLTYLVCGIGASAVSFAFMGRYLYYSEGASGAIFGLLGVLAVLAYRERLNMQPIIAVIVINLAFSFAVPGIDWHDHLGGLASGLILGAAFAFAPRPRQRVPWYRDTQLLVPLGAGVAILAASALTVVIHSDTLLHSGVAGALLG